MKKQAWPCLAAVVFICFATTLVAESLAFVRGDDGALWVRDRSSWKSLGGQLLGSPDACSWGPDRLDVVARGMEGNLVQMSRIRGRWTGWVDLGGTLVTDPSCVSWGPNRIDIFATGASATVIHKAWDGARWTEWESFDGEVREAVDAASWGPNRIDVFARGTDDALWQLAWNGERWTGWNRLGGRILSSPGAVSWGPNRIDVFARGENGVIRQIAWDGEQWSQWFDHGGPPELWSGPAGGRGPDVTSLGVNRLEVYFLGADRDLRRKTWNGTRWSGWQSLGGRVNGDPGAVALRTTQVPAVASAPVRSRFRIEIEGFTVNRASWDDILSRDGKGDEVFIAYEARVLGSEDEVKATTGLIRTPVFGDINHDDWRTTRTKAGSWSDLGGLKSGDVQSLGITAWEGTLEAGGDSVLLIPTVWEWDGNQDFLTNVFRFLAAPVALAGEGVGQAIHVRTPTSLDAAQQAFSPVMRTLSGSGEIGSDIVTSKSVFGDPKDRPIGMKDDGGTYRFEPQALQINYETAVQLSGDRGGFRVPFRFADAEELKGDYTLHVKVVKLDR
jgi:hypothetical protein